MIAPKGPVDTGQNAWDVIVIGAGPAGTGAARQAAAQGFTTLLVDRKQFPRFKVCGACINQRAVASLRSMGLGQALAELGAVALQTFQLEVDGRSSSFPLQGGISLSRAALDMLLVEAAVRAGCHFLCGTSAVLLADPPAPSSHRHVQLKGSSGARRVEAKVVLVADGLRGSSVQGCEELPDRIAPHARIGLGAAIGDRSDAYRPGVIYMGVTRRGYAGVVRTEDGDLNLAAAVDPDFIKASGGAADAIERVLREARLPLPTALERADWQGTVPMTRARRALASHRVFVIGDAAGYVEPFTGEGIAWAIASGLAVQPYVRQAVQRWRSELTRHWSRAHRRAVGRRQRVCRVVAAGLRHPGFVGRAAHLLARVPLLSHPLARNLSGY